MTYERLLNEAGDGFYVHGESVTVTEVEEYLDEETYVDPMWTGMDPVEKTERTRMVRVHHDGYGPPVEIKRDRFMRLVGEIR